MGTQKRIHLIVRIDNSDIITSVTACVFHRAAVVGVNNFAIVVDVAASGFRGGAIV